MSISPTTKTTHGVEERKEIHYAGFSKSGADKDDAMDEELAHGGIVGGGADVLDRRVVGVVAGASAGTTETHSRHRCGYGP